MAEELDSFCFCIYEQKRNTRLTQFLHVMCVYIVSNKLQTRIKTTARPGILVLSQALYRINVYIYNMVYICYTYMY